MFCYSRGHCCDMCPFEPLEAAVFCCSLCESEEHEVQDCPERRRLNAERDFQREAYCDQFQ